MLNAVKKPMKITKQELREMGACKDGLKRFIKQTGGTSEPVEVSSLVGGENTVGDLLWLAGKRLPQDRIVRFACDCALINIELIKPYTNDYDLIVDFLNNPAAAAYTAAYAAYTAAYAAYAAADAADAAAADAAARAASYAARVAGSEKEVNELLIRLFS